jgi:catechol 2,3-dioxygenase
MPENDLTATDLPVLCPVFHHINLKTNQLDALVEWYATVVGARVTFRRHDIAFVTNDAANHRIAITANKPYVEPEGGRGAHVGLHHTAFEYRSLDELLQTWVRLDREGIVPAFCLDHGPTMSFYYRDPDANFVELQADNWDNSQQSAQFMRENPRFFEDPIGKPVAPEKVLEARQSGLSPWEVHVAAYRGELAPDVVTDRTDRG